MTAWVRQLLSIGIPFPAPRTALTGFGLVLPSVVLLCGSGCADRRTLLAPSGATRNLTHGVSRRFVNITASSHLNSFTHTDGSSGRKYFVEQVGSGCAIFDYDNDGWPDIYLCNGAPLPGCRGSQRRNALFHNNRDGTFTDVTDKAGVGGEGHYCTGVVAGDFDNDGYLDLYVCCFGKNILYHNNGNGTFTDVTARAGVASSGLSTSATWFDYDHDGYLDLYVDRYVKYDLKHDKVCGRSAAQRSYCGPITYPPDTGTLYHNNGNGTFTDVSVKAGIRAEARPGLGVISFDYDGDGRPDLFVSDDQAPNILWHNNGDGTFTNRALEMGVAVGARGTAEAGMGVDVGDPRNVGAQDIFMSDFTEEPDSLFEAQNGYYRDVSDRVGIGGPTLMTLGFGGGFLDYDNDGWLDVFVANGHVMDDIASYSDVVTWKQPNQMFHNRGNGTYEDVSLQTVGPGRNVSRGVAFGDLFNNGRTDILVNTLRDHPILLRNDWAPENHWLTVQLHASWGSPQAVGATVYLTSGKITQRRDVRAGGSYESSNDLRPHFGLGKTPDALSLKINWPSGRSTVIDNPKPDEILQVYEPNEKK